MLRKKIKKLIIKALLILSCFSVFIFPIKSVHAQVNERPTIILDLAHLDRYEPSNGIIDNGATFGSLNERELVNEISLLVKDKLEKANFNIVMTRDYNTPMTIEQRVTMINNTQADMFLSIHANATESHQGTGIEGFSNGAWSLTNAICKAVESQLGLVYRGTKATPYYNQYINKSSTLLELGFIDNEYDRNILINNKDKFADIIAEAIINQYQNENNIQVATNKTNEDLNKPKTKIVTEHIKMSDGTYIKVNKTIEVK